MQWITSVQCHFIIMLNQCFKLIDVWNAFFMLLNIISKYLPYNKVDYFTLREKEIAVTLQVIYLPVSFLIRYPESHSTMFYKRNSWHGRACINPAAMGSNSSTVPSALGLNSRSHARAKNQKCGSTFFLLCLLSWTSQSCFYCKSHKKMMVYADSVRLWFSN